MTTATLLKGNCLDHLRTIADESVHAIVTDPPYGLANTDPAHVVEALTKWATGNREFIPEGRGFMGKAWDAFVPPPAVWDECFRILKPGGHLLAFAGSRTFDLMTLSIRFAGLDIRDSIAWLYGSGFPKSLDVSKAIDKAAGAEREVIGANPNHRPISGIEYEGTYAGGNTGSKDLTAPATPDAEKWQGWGTALKPAFEPIVVARKPLIGTVAANVLTHGTGAINIDASRIQGVPRPAREVHALREGVNYGGTSLAGRVDNSLQSSKAVGTTEQGRWPANVMLDESQAAALDEQTGTETSRFFYVAKAPKPERPVIDGESHPTVKPLALMRQLIKLATTPGGIVVDPFAGSGTTLEAAHLEGFDSIGIEMTETYWPLIRHRIERAEQAASAKTSADDEALFSWDEPA